MFQENGQRAGQKLCYPLMLLFFSKVAISVLYAKRCRGHVKGPQSCQARRFIHIHRAGEMNEGLSIICLQRLISKD